MVTIEGYTVEELYKIVKHAEVEVTEADSGAAVNQLGEDIPDNKVRYIFFLRMENYGAGKREAHLYKGHTADPDNVRIDSIQISGDGAEVVHDPGIKAPLYVIRPYVQDTQATPVTAVQWNQFGITYEDTDPAGGSGELHLKISYYDLPIGR